MDYPKLTRFWHGGLTLERGVAKPEGLNITMSELAYIASMAWFISITEEKVAEYKKYVTQNKANTYPVAVKFFLSDEDYENLSEHRFKRTYVSCALTYHIKCLMEMPPADRNEAFISLEEVTNRCREEARKQGLL